MAFCEDYIEHHINLGYIGDIDALKSQHHGRKAQPRIFNCLDSKKIK